jgi:asparagine synthase (glutamine-hydrolysing)
VCGFAGYLDLSGKGRISRDRLIRMGESLIHRGPDDLGYHVGEQLGLGFRRLSIVDLAGGAQPMYSADRSIVMVCNGEIFNHRELRAELTGKGHRFKTSCDVEVLPYLYQEHGVELLDRLNGQFAFAIFDQQKQRLLLARDHVGIIPLYYTVQDGILIFGSEIKALLQHGALRAEVNLTGLDQVLSMPGLVSPETMFKGVHSLPPGHCLIVENGDLRVKSYWDLDYPRADEPIERHPEDYYVEGLAERLTRSVKYRLQADVPVGFYLSGGLDSSLLAGIIHALVEGQSRHSFSIGFNDRQMSEVRYQQLMADYVGSIHHEIIFDWSEIVERLREMVYHAECPVKETYNTCSMALAQAAKSNGISVILTGEGADELFAGYVGYRFDQSQRRGHAALSEDLESSLEAEMCEQVWGDPDLFYEHGFLQLGELKRALYSPAVNDQLDDFDCFRRPIVDQRKLAGRHRLHQRSYLDFKLRLADHLLTDHGDRMAMARSVECRYPFLDRDVIEFARTMPPDLKLNGTSEKYVVKQVARRLIPTEIIDRQKFGFHAPGSPYLLKQKIAWIQDMLSYERIRRQGYFNPDFVEQLKSQYGKPDFRLNLPFENDLLMIVLSFGVFLDVFGLPSAC